MSQQLKEYNWPDVKAIELDEYGNQADINPGTLVRHKLHATPIGICISRRWTDDDKPMQVKVLWTVAPHEFGPFTMPSIRGLQSQLMANKLVEVQPMSGPQGNIFYMDYTYPSGSV